MASSKPNHKHYPIVHARVSEYTDNTLRRRANQHGVSLSLLVKLIIEDFIKNNRKITV